MKVDNKLQPGYEVMTVSGKRVVVEEHLGEGGQGDVYRVSYEGQHKALKWYKEGGMGTDPQAFYENLKNNLYKGSPSPEFLWMTDLTEWQDDSCGYVMDLRPEGYYEVGDFLLKHANFRSFRTVVDASLKIVSAFRILHNRGCAYQDMNDGNFFINPRNGKVLICDNDNVVENQKYTGIIGKPRYMAPEIVRGEKMPDQLSDRYSMSLILYLLFCRNHPLEGVQAIKPSLSKKDERKLYGTEPMFIMDPENTNNRPDPTLHRNSIEFWPYLPEYMKEIFLKALGQKALKNPSVRPAELEWMKALVRFRSEILPCACGNEVFTDQGQSCQCEECGRIIHVPLRLSFYGYSVPALQDSRIYRCQVGICNADEALMPVGNIIRDGEKLKIKNLSDKIWHAVTPSGNARKVMPGEMIPLIDKIEAKVIDETIRIEAN